MNEQRPPRRTVPRRTDLAPDLRSGHHRKGTPAREGQTLPGATPWVRYANLVRLPHTIFALPFALLGVVYASWITPVSGRQLALVVVAFTAARFAAMGFNRIVDRHYDAANPRTRGREIPAGAMSVPRAAAAVAVAAAVFVGTAALLNPLCLLLSGPALAWILVYSYTKRFTNWSHLWLGASLAMAPAGGYLAITGTWSTPAWMLPLLGAAVLTWVAGFDMFYALQDEAFDREHDLRSAVVLLGARRSILVAKVLHGITVGILVLFGIVAGFGPVYLVGIGVAAGILVWEHQLVRADDLSRLDAAFFTMNGVMSLIVLAGALGDRLL